MFHMTKHKNEKIKVKRIVPEKLHPHKAPKLYLDEGATLLMKELVKEFPEIDKSRFQNCFNKVYNNISDQKYGDNVFETVVINNKIYYVNSLGKIFNLIDDKMHLCGYSYRNNGKTEYNIFKDMLNDDKINEYINSIKIE